MSREDAELYLEGAAVGRLAVSQGGQPYIVPILFHYDRSGGEILLHCAKKGRKIDAIAANASVSFEVDEMRDVVNSDAPCEFDLLYKSVIAEGTASLVEDPAAKASALNAIFRKYAPKHGGTISPEMAKGTAIISIKVSSVSGKQAVGETIPYPQ